MQVAAMTIESLSLKFRINFLVPEENVMLGQSVRVHGLKLKSPSIATPVREGADELKW